MTRELPIVAYLDDGRRVKVYLRDLGQSEDKRYWISEYDCEGKIYRVECPITADNPAAFRLRFDCAYMKACGIDISESPRRALSDAALGKAFRALVYGVVE